MDTYWQTEFKKSLPWEVNEIDNRTNKSLTEMTKLSTVSEWFQNVNTCLIFEQNITLVKS